MHVIRGEQEFFKRPVRGTVNVVGVRITFFVSSGSTIGLAEFVTAHGA
jgi:hypothetical protein